MDEKWRKFKSRYKEDRQLRHKIYIGFVCVAVCCLFVGILAKYIYEKATQTSQITADQFYFTADLLGDTKMVSTEGEEGTTYSFGEKSTSGIWYLYGASTHNINIKVQNYFDELRINEQDISYEGDISVKDPKGNEITTVNNLALKDGETTFTQGTLKAGNDQRSKTLTAAIPSHTDWQYEDGTTVTVTIQSTAPYKKTLTMKFILYATDTTMKYQINDSAGSPYAELILMTNVDADIQPYLDWSDELEIDNTNPLTFTYNGNQFVQQTGMENRNMQISQALKSGRSETIYFFKNDTSKNYAKSETIVNQVDGKYTIAIGK